MNIYCTRPNCPKPQNSLLTFTHEALKASPLQFCRTCAMPLLLNRRYLPLKRMKVGVSDSLFLAQDLHSELEQRVVITQLRAETRFSPRQMAAVKEKFKQEAKVLEIFGAEHPQISVVYDFFESDVLSFSKSQLLSDTTDQFFYIVQEYIEGQTLAQELSHNGQLSEPRIIKILHHILPVLQFIHNHEYSKVHQNITPDSLVRDRKGKLHLTNFGTVKQAMVASSQSLIQVSNSSPIEPASLFIPPEQQPNQQVYPSSDLYSLAVTMLYLLTGQNLHTLFDSDSHRWYWQPYAQVSDRLYSVLNRMLQPSPQERFQSAAEVLAALRQTSTIRAYSNGFNQAERVEVEKEGRSSNLTVLSQLELAQFQAEIIKSEALAPKLDVQLHSFESKVPASKIPASKVLESKLLESKVQPTVSRESSEENSEENRIEKPLEPLWYSLILGSGSWLIAVALVSFFGTLLASGLWLVILTGAIFGIVAKEQSSAEKARLFIIAIASVGATYYLVPQFFRVFDFAKALPQLLLMAVAAGLLTFVLIMLSQLIYDSLSQ